MATMEKASLLALPAELILEICSYLCWSRPGTGLPYVDDPPIAAMQAEAAVCQTALDALGRTCTRLHGVAHGLLYRAPCITRTDGLEYLVRTMAARPDLAAAVVELRDLRTRIYDDALLKESGPGPEYQVFRYHTPTGLAAAALAVMPNLVCAHLRVPDEMCFAPDRLVPADKPPSLKALTLSSPGTRLELTMSLFQQPCLANLEHLHIHGGMRVFPEFTAGLPQPRLQNLASLTLTSTNLSPNSVRHLLALVGNQLTAVHISYNRPTTFVLEFESTDDELILAVTLNDVLDLCYPWRTTLTSLSFYREDRLCQPILYTNLDKLPDYTALRSLSAEACSLRMFFPAHHEFLGLYLPPSIQSLRVFGKGYGAAALETLLNMRLAGQFPHLQTVGLNAIKPGAAEAVEFSNLARVYRTAGLGLYFEDIGKI